jgi:hypothetical protein
MADFVDDFEPNNSNYEGDEHEDDHAGRYVEDHRIFRVNHVT